MRAIEFIIEGYPEARQEFTTATGDQNLAIKTIDQFRDLVNRNQVQGNERNIDWWRKQGWNLFYPFVTQKSQEASKTQIKRKKVPGRSINLLETEEWLVVIPLDKEASCFHGRQSDWCTTKPQQPYFEQYFYDREITLIYCLNKKTAAMWAIAAHIKKPDQPEIFDQRDKKINAIEFNQQTGLNSQDLIKLALGEQYQDPIGQAREGYRSSITRTEELLAKYKSSTARVPEIEKELLFNKDGTLATQYIQLLIKNKISIDGVPEAILLTAMTNDGVLIRYLKNPSEAVQLAAVKQNGASIKYIKNPLEAVQLAALENDESAIALIDNIAPEVFEKYPKLKDTILAQPDEVLKSVIERIKELTLDYIWDKIYDWKSHDDYFYAWQAEQALELGYVDDQGEIDWDQVHEDDTLSDYLEYDLDARDLLNNVKYALELTPESLKQITKEFVGEYKTDSVYMSNLDLVYGLIFENEVGDHGENLSDWIKKSIDIYKSPDGNWIVRRVR